MYMDFQNEQGLAVIIYKTVCGMGHYKTHPILGN